MIKAVIRDKGSSLKVGQGFPKTVDIKGVRVYLNSIEYLVVSKPMSAKVIEKELKTFGASMALEDRIKVSKHLFDTSEVIKTSHQGSYEDNSDEASAIEMEKVVIYPDPSNEDFSIAEYKGEKAYNIGYRKGRDGIILEALTVWWLPLDEVIVDIDSNGRMEVWVTPDENEL